MAALTAKRVERIKEPGRYACGLVRGLHLQVGAGGARSWTLRYQIGGRERWVGLGLAPEVALQGARARAKEARLAISGGIDPVEQKHASRSAARAAQAGSMSFGECVEAYYALSAPNWKHDKHRHQWSASMLGRTPAGNPARPDYLAGFRKLPITEVTTAAVIKLL